VSPPSRRSAACNEADYGHQTRRWFRHHIRRDEINRPAVCLAEDFFRLQRKVAFDAQMIRFAAGQSSIVAIPAVGAERKDGGSADLGQQYGHGRVIELRLSPERRRSAERQSARERVRRVVQKREVRIEKRFGNVLLRGRKCRTVLRRGTT